MSLLLSIPLYFYKWQNFNYSQVKSALPVTIIGTWFPLSLSGPIIFFTLFLPNPVEEGEYKSPWVCVQLQPRSTHLNGTGQLMISVEMLPGPFCPDLHHCQRSGHPRGRSQSLSFYLFIFISTCSVSLVQLGPSEWQPCPPANWPVSLLWCHLQNWGAFCSPRWVTERDVKRNRCQDTALWYPSGYWPPCSTWPIYCQPVFFTFLVVLPPRL